MILQSYNTELCYGTILQNYITQLYCGIVFQKYITEWGYGIILQNYVMELYYRKYMTELCYGTVLGNCTRKLCYEVYYRIISWKHVMEFDYSILGIPVTLQCPFVPLGNLSGRPRTGPPPRTTKTAISQQVKSARSFRMLHPNPFVATTPRAPLDRFLMCTTRTKSLFVTRSGHVGGPRRP